MNWWNGGTRTEILKSPAHPYTKALIRTIPSMNEKLPVTAGISAFVLMSGTQILSIFCKEEAVIEEGLRIIRVTFPFYFLYAILEVTGGIVRGNKKTMQSMLIVIVDLCIIRIILLGILTRRFHTIQAVAAVYPLTWALAAFSFVGYYLKSRVGEPILRTILE